MEPSAAKPVLRRVLYVEDNATNMRLFEATGCGAMLITDAKQNLGDLFSVGVEIVAYRDEVVDGRFPGPENTYGPG